MTTEELELELSEIELRFAAAEERITQLERKLAEFSSIVDKYRDRLATNLLQIIEHEDLS